MRSKDIIDMVIVAQAAGAFLDNICHNREPSFLKAIQQPCHTKLNHRKSIRPIYMAICPHWSDRLAVHIAIASIIVLIS